MTEYITLPSKINDHSLDELDMYDSNRFGVVINKLLNIAINPNKPQINALNELARKIALIDNNQPIYHYENKSRTKTDP